MSALITEFKGKYCSYNQIDFENHAIFVVTNLSLLKAELLQLFKEKDFEIVKSILTFPPRSGARLLAGCGKGGFLRQASVKSHKSWF